MAGPRPAHARPDTPPARGPDRSELDHLFSITYEELRRLAATVRTNEPTETLNPTALVNEAYMKLAGSLRSAPTSVLHFKRIAARAMRQVLVEGARRRRALKRGGCEVFVALDEALGHGAGSVDDVIALDAALHDLARTQPRQAQMIEYRFFGGFNLAETAALLGVSEATVARDWRTARAWLALELRAAR